MKRPTIGPWLFVGVVAAMVALGLGVVFATSLLSVETQSHRCQLNPGVSERGLPPPGQAYVGVTAPSAAAVDAVQQWAGARLAIRRTYWGAQDTSRAVAAAREDLSAGRIPWLSFKLPFAWDQMASGAGDSWARQLANELGGLPGPVWVALHHEPEGDGTIADWVAMQRRLGPMLHAQSNVAFSIIVTGWNQLYSGNPEFSLDALWPGDGFVDLVGFDPYNFSGTQQQDGGEAGWRELDDYATQIDLWSQQHPGIRWAIAETGYTHGAARADADWLPRAFDSVRAAGGSALVYFDLDDRARPSWTWSLSTPEKQAAFSRALAASSYAMEQGCL